MKILVINASPVRNGATAEIVRLVSGYLYSDNEVTAICIDDYEIKYCKGCRNCHKTASCVIDDDVNKLVSEFAAADKIICVAPSYWADVPGQFKVFIDRLTPWSNTHEPHASIPFGKQGYAIALRTGPNMSECERIIKTIEHFMSHLNISFKCGLGLCSVECRDDVEDKIPEIKAFCEKI